MEAVKTADFKMAFDPTLVRGMSYYTGPIFEISMDEFGGSVGGALAIPKTKIPNLTNSKEKSKILITMQKHAYYRFFQKEIIIKIRRSEDGPK